MLIVALGVLATAAAALHRYEVHSCPVASFCIRLDRWTGEIERVRTVAD